MRADLHEYGTVTLEHISPHQLVLSLSAFLGMLEKRKNDEVRGRSELKLRTPDVRVLSHFCGLQEEGQSIRRKQGSCQPCLWARLCIESTAS